MVVWNPPGNLDERLLETACYRAEARCSSTLGGVGSDVVTVGHELSWSIPNAGSSTIHLPCLVS